MAKNHASLASAPGSQNSSAYRIRATS